MEHPCRGGVTGRACVAFLFVGFLIVTTASLTGRQQGANYNSMLVSTASSEYSDGCRRR